MPTKVNVGITDSDILEIINEEYKVEIKVEDKTLILKCRPLSASEFGQISTSELDRYKKMRAVLDAVLIQPAIIKGKKLPVGFVMSAYNQIMTKSFLQYALGIE